MAEAKPKRLIKKTETVRQRAAKADQPKQPRRVRLVTASATGKVKDVTKLGSREIHPVKLPDTKAGRFFGKSRRFVPKFFREAWAELRQVTWPNRRETIRLTSAVLIFAIVFGGLIALTDYGLEKFFRNVLLK